MRRFVSPEKIESSPTKKLKIGVLFMLASFPLFLPLFVTYFAIILFFAGVIVYSEGLIQNLERERAKKQAASVAESTKR